MIVDPETILEEECSKIPCKRYMTVGDCAFGTSCRFSHYTPPMIWELQRLGNLFYWPFSSSSRREHVNLQQIKFSPAVAMKNFKDSTNQPKDGWPNPEDIIKEYFENVTDSSGTEDRNSAWNVPSRLVNYSYLPPSLQPVALESMTDCSFSKWGWALFILKIKQ